MLKKKKIIYLDHAASTPISNEVIRDIKNFISYYGNPSSVHFKGEEAKNKIEKCREEIANYIGAKKEEIFFTSGATESNNTIIKGIAKYNKEKKKILISEIEHSSVIESCNYLKKEGFEIEKIKVTKEGIIDLKDLKSKIDDKTLIVCVMHVNNEIGTIQPIKEISKICKEKKVYFHSDMVQSFTKIDINIKKIDIDFASFSGHKINALKGIGFFYMKKGLKIEPLINGGGQEKNIRSGTENFLGIVSIASAIKIKRNREKIRKQRDLILNKLLKIKGAKLNGSLEKRIYNNINVSFEGVDAENMVFMLSEKGVCVSSGSACSSRDLYQSHVLKAIGLKEKQIKSSIRITIDEMENEEIEYFIKSLKYIINKLKK
ncbi:MAG: cysteine desulfurase family protein [Candidatus Pacearchaeota archaeon]